MEEILLRELTNESKNVANCRLHYNDGTKDIVLTNADRSHTYASSNEYSPTLIITNSVHFIEVLLLV
jgi:hypothetical protein